jgi:hypothetical protein
MILTRKLNQHMKQIYYLKVAHNFNGELEFNGNNDK